MVFNWLLAKDSLEKSFLIIAYEHPGIIIPEVKLNPWIEFSWILQSYVSSISEPIKLNQN